MPWNAFDHLLDPLGDASATGADLEYDSDFLALERAAASRGERVIGDAVKAAEEPDWERVAQQAEALFERTRDLRIAVHLAMAWLRTAGFGGWSAGLALIHGLLENFWDEVYPQLDADDDNDPTARVNAIVPISDLQGALGYLRTTPFVQSPRLGRYSLRDLRIANGSLKIETSSADELPTMAQIEACCLDCDEATLIRTLQDMDRATELARAIDALFMTHLGTAGPDLKALLTDMGELRKFVGAQVTRRTPGADMPETSSAEAVPEASPAAVVMATPGRIQGPQDVSRRLDELCEYYATCEPSSPVPLLLRRAQRLIGMSFIDLLQDLAPGGLGELRVVSGQNED